ncbi:hypothetical protein EHI8A_015610 [Entamoeba histolytica HM-1:IMSS-B]|uniref:Uncharacterized protein n=5 Tax=Entamoeba histolytica TaxID=5759 RepID=C4M6A0_ENTH1|nr:hypothetical protein EHI_082490 [Entamoeba histolytica HM-1:IMSS]EMH72415.1 hypothetical protein EHI8A_015610 [Entamoeba histolytica HM-1:IMSS-B]EMS10983.1 hypothetical protein KM1_061950 [Entamoeba histolytica HM-3:IMSS]ENY65423.1 hypothetical protein EHI7A_020600 [Entamoeba histolytica HM-1:IMSS-A]GAT96992.1 hypothetical protein CL6EHI_082490 [Entamoeba histolytica]EAL43294.1 hypothetical protein EHI_082490 [Entamoeba histolytica HM-1:IMSS]|eukprot:XP_648685.1 hypothetical protein EHI_082490 [Entamoeba histolytica HM-1:IMSS]
MILFFFVITILINVVHGQYPTTTPQQTNQQTGMQQTNPPQINATTFDNKSFQKQVNADFEEAQRQRVVRANEQKKIDSLTLSQIEAQRRQVFENYNKMKLEEKRLKLAVHGKLPGQKADLISDPLWKRIGLPDPSINTTNPNMTNGTNMTYPNQPLFTQNKI